MGRLDADGRCGATAWQPYDFQVATESMNLYLLEHFGFLQFLAQSACPSTLYDPHIAGRAGKTSCTDAFPLERRRRQRSV